MKWQLQETRALQVEFSSILPTDGYRLSLFGRGPIALHGLVHFLNTIGPSLTKVIYAYFDRISYIILKIVSRKKSYEKQPAGLEMGRVKTAFSCDWQEVNHAFRSVFSCFYVVHEGQFYCDFEFSLGFTVYS